MSASQGYFVNKKSDLEDACQHLARMHAPTLPLWRAAADGVLGIVVMHGHDAPWPAATIKRIGARPTVALICDDPDIGDGAARGPAGWSCATRLKYWPAAVMVHGAGGEPAHYREVAVAAEAVGRVALIETSSACASIWAQFLQCRRTLLIVPPNGRPHPLPLEERVMQ